MHVLTSCEWLHLITITVNSNKRQSCDHITSIKIIKIGQGRHFRCRCPTETGKCAIKTSGATQFPWGKTQQDEQKRREKLIGGKSFHPKGSSRSFFWHCVSHILLEMELTTPFKSGPMPNQPRSGCLSKRGWKTLGYFWQGLEKQRGRQRFHHGNQKQIDWHLGSEGNMKGATERRWGWELKRRRNLTAGNIKHV